MAEHTLVLADGAELRYDRLLIATGARARHLPALTGRSNVSVLRTIDDGRALRDALGRAARVAVIGAGFIGQEVAATARECGCDVTMVEAAPQPLAAVVGTHVGAWFAQLHRAKGSRCSPGGPYEGFRATVPSPGWSSPTVAGSLWTTWWSASALTPTHSGWRARA